jgi:hypothetical protein
LTGHCLPRLFTGARGLFTGARGLFAGDRRLLAAGFFGAGGRKQQNARQNHYLKGQVQVNSVHNFDFWFSHRVSYGETDSMGVLYYAEYLHIFERARNQFIRDRGLSYAMVEERGLFLPVREARCR